MSLKLSLKLNKKNFSDFVSKIQDLSNIEDVVKLKIDKNKILMYSLISNNSMTLALKNYLVDTSDYIDNFDKEDMFDLIITSASKFVKNLKFFNTENNVKLDIVYKPTPDNENVMHIRTAYFSDGRLKISCVGGEEHKINNITIPALEKRLNMDNSRWNFKMTKEDFSDVKKLAQINNEEKILNINVKSEKVTVSEKSKWEIHIDTISFKDTNLIFGKKYLSNVNADSEYIYFNIFDTFMLVKDDISNLMLSFEQSFDDD
jgi:hypothetical protein